MSSQIIQVLLGLRLRHIQIHVSAQNTTASVVRNAHHLIGTILLLLAFYQS